MGGGEERVGGGVGAAGAEEGRGMCGFAPAGDLLAPLSAERLEFVVVVHGEVVVGGKSHPNISHLKPMTRRSRVAWHPRLFQAMTSHWNSTSSFTAFFYLFF